MRKETKEEQQPVLYLVLHTTSSNEHYNGDCDYALIPITAGYLASLLRGMAQMDKLHAKDKYVYCIETWDATPSYFTDCDRFSNLRDFDGNLASEVPRGEMILLADDDGAEFENDMFEFQAVDCQTVHVGHRNLWWTCMVRHSDVRIETLPFRREDVQRLRQGFEKCGFSLPNREQIAAIPQAIQQIHDFLYLDMKAAREFYNPDKFKSRPEYTLDAIADVVARYIPRPKEFLERPERPEGKERT